MRSMFFILSLCFCGTLSAHERDSGTSLEVLVGASLGYRTIEISERESVMEVAEFQTDGLNVSPSISLRTEPKYIWQDRNWSYTFSADFLLLNLISKLWEMVAVITALFKTKAPK